MSVALLDACARGDLQRAESVLQALPYCVCSRTPDLARTPLHVAAANGFADIARFIMHTIHHELTPEAFSAASSAGLVSSAFVLELSINGPIESFLHVVDDYSSTPLHLAAAGGHHEVVELLLQYGADVDRRDDRQRTPLHYACTTGHTDTIRLLLLLHARARIPTAPKELQIVKDGLTSRERVLRLSNSEAGEKEKAEVKLIAKASHSALQRTDSPARPLQRLQKIQNSVSKRLFESSAAIRRTASRDATSKTPVRGQRVESRTRQVTYSEALMRRDAEKVEDAEEEGDEFIPYSDKQDDLGDTALHVACAHGHEEAVRALLTNGASVRVCNGVGLRPLHVACKGGHVVVMRILLGEGHAGVNVQDETGLTPLHYAALSSRSEMAELLLRTAKASPLATDLQGRTADVIAMSRDARRVIVRFTESGLFLRAIPFIGLRRVEGSVRGVHVMASHRKKVLAKSTASQKGWSLLHEAANEGNLQLLEALLEMSDGLDVNVTNDDGNTPLHYFVRCWCAEKHEQFEDVLKKLLLRGAAINAQNSFGETPLYRCSVRRNKLAMHALIRHGADVNLKTKDGGRCLDIAVKRKDKVMVESLLVAGASPRKQLLEEAVKLGASGVAGLLRSAIRRQTSHESSTMTREQLRREFEEARTRALEHDTGGRSLFPPEHLRTGRIRDCDRMKMRMKTWVTAGQRTRERADDPWEGWDRLSMEIKRKDDDSGGGSGTLQ